MAEEEKTVKLGEGQVVVDQASLVAVQEQLAEMQKQLVDQAAKNAGLEELFANSQGPDTTGERKLREKKNFEPEFRTARVRKYPMGGDPENLGYIIGWTSRGAYPKVVDTGIQKEKVDYVDVIFLGHEHNAEGKLQAESIPLLSMLNDGKQVHCKILDVKRETHKVPTGEEIHITTWDPQHGLMQTGEVIDGYVAYTDMQYTVQIPGVEGSTIVDFKFLN